MRETQLMVQIRAAISATGRATLWRNNTGFASKEKVRYGLGVGSADLVGFIHSNGRFFALEIKTPTGRVAPEQTLWRDFVNLRGGYCAIVRTVDEALAALEEACKHKTT